MRTVEPMDKRIARMTLVDERGCWLWQGALRSDGYVQIKITTGFRQHRLAYAHRVAYEALVGPIPEGLTIDHLCRVRHCCNPAHLEVVTHRENCLRGTGVSAIAVTKTHCPQGHEYTPENTQRGGKGERVCATCKRARSRAYKERRRRSRIAA